MRPEQERVRKLLTEAVTLLCRNSLQFKDEVTVEGLLGITLDQRDIFLVSIHETVQSAFKEANKRSHDDETEEESTPSPNSKRRRVRRRRSSRDSQSPPPSPQPVTKEEPGGLLLDVEEGRDDIRVKQERGDDHSRQTELRGERQDERYSDRTPDNRDYSKTQGQDHDRDSSQGQQFSTEARALPNLAQMLPSSGSIVKEEAPDDQCFVIESDDEEDRSLSGDNSQSNPLPRSFNLADAQLVPAQGAGWAQMEGGGFGDADMLAAAQQFNQKGGAGWPQGFDVSQLSGSSNNSTMQQFLDQSQGGSQQFPSTSQQSSPGDPNQREVCPICHRAFQHLKRHIRDVHLKERPFACRQCGATFSQKGTRDRHEIRIHTGRREFVCEFCQRRFKVKWDLTVHLRGVCSGQPRAFSPDSVDMGTGNYSGGVLHPSDNGDGEFETSHDQIDMGDGNIPQPSTRDETGDFSYPSVSEEGAEAET